MGGEGQLSPFQTKSAKSYLMLPNVFGLCALAFDIYVRITLSRFEQWHVKSESPHIKSKYLQKPFFLQKWVQTKVKVLQNVPKLPQITPEVPKIMNLGRTYFLYWASPNNFLHCDSAFLHQA